ncbi:MAG: potassium-transporting ATPase subunit KdpC [Polyangiaceae bacterium]
MSKLLRPSAVMLLLFTVLCGAAYPALVTGVAQAAFPRQANGSLLSSGDKIVGSSLIGQPFTGPAYFWSRPSATAPFADNAAASSGSNLGPTNPALLEAVEARVAALRAADPDNDSPVPVDLVTASGSGLDPHISPAAAHYQATRVARARGLALADVEKLVEKHTEGRLFGFLGEPHVNVLELNLDLDSVKPVGP